MRIIFRAALIAGTWLALVGGSGAAERALLVGIDSYASPELARGGFGAAARDLDRMRGLLTQTLGFPEASVQTLANEAATKAAILGAVERFLGEAGPEDEALFYFAGLGHFAPDDNGDETDKLDEALVPADATASGPDALGGLIRDDELVAALSKLKAKRVTVVLDAAFSGRVTRGGGEGAVQGVRAPVFAAKTRKILVEPAAQAQKAEPAVFEAPGAAPLVIWTAGSGSQLALVDPPEPGKARGVFTELFAAGLEGKADANGNGRVSAAELLAFVRAGSAEACGRRKSDCEMGLVPALGPEAALAGDTLPRPATGSAAAVPAPSSGGPVTADRVTDLLAARNDGSVVIEQTPPSPVPVGTRNIRFRVSSKVEGYLVLLSLEDDGSLVQLFPNEFSRDRFKEGRIRAGQALTIPDANYGFRIDATAPSSGTLIAVLLSEPPDSKPGALALPKGVRTRKIEVIAREEVAETVLPELAAAGTRIGAESADANTASADRRIAVLRYEMVKP